MAMGDGILTLAVQKLSEFLIQETTFLLGVKDDVKTLRDELIWMQSFLEDAEQKEGTDNRIRLWINEIRSIAFKAEDIVDTYYEEVKGKEPSKRKLLITSLRKFFCIAGETNVYDIGKEIVALNERLSDISRKREVYGINYISNTQETTYVASHDRLRDLRRTTSLADEEHFVGFDDDFNLVETQLLLSEKRRSVISIWGMGGLGKTSLARKLYNTNKYEFELHAWVCVSQEWNTRYLLERILKSLKKPTYEELKMLEKMNDDDMKRHLHEVLKDKRYLVVIDDLWEEEAWECLRSALPDNQNGSRIIITTRKESVAELSDSRTYVHKLRRLRDNESWELFCKKAFSNQNGACSQDLEKIGKEMVAKCAGLPLAIIVLGGFLARKQSNEWHAIKKRVWKALIDKSDHILALLDLSYNDLSHELKSCFLYLGIFPEDYEIYTEKLIQLWIVEDLIPQSEGHDLEEVAHSYIKELSARSLIQVTKNEILNSTYRVHDLLRDLAVNKAKVRDFFHIYEESANPSITPLSTRRIAFRSGFDKYVAAIDDQSHPRVHTLSFLNYQSLLDDDDVTKLLTLISTRFKSLRVLDLEGVKIKTKESKLKLFEAMGKLVHLRYLGLYDTDIDELPESIGNLQALQALNTHISDNDVNILLPRDMCKLKHLRHLIGSFQTRKGDIPSLEDLTNLHYLVRIEISGWLENEESDEFALKAFSKLRNLRILSVDFAASSYRLSIEPLFSCKNLIILGLCGSLESLPTDLHESLPNLTHLTLFRSEFVEDPLPALGKLPNLLLLSLDGFMVKSLIITVTGFYKLVYLEITDFPEDMKLHIKEGALLSLRYINPELKKITLPERLRDLPYFVQ